MIPFDSQFSLLATTAGPRLWFETFTNSVRVAIISIALDGEKCLNRMLTESCQATGLPGGC
jgi:hypothetical protein